MDVALLYDRSQCDLHATGSYSRHVCLMLSFSPKPGVVFAPVFAFIYKIPKLDWIFFSFLVHNNTNWILFLIQKNINFPAFYALESFRFVIHRQAFVHVCN